MRRGAGFALGPILVVALLYNVSLTMVLTLVPLQLDDLGFSPALVGLVVSYPAFMQILLRIPGGLAADRWGERTVLIASLLSMAAAGPLYVSGGLGPLVAAQTLSGFSRTIYWPAAQSYVTKLPGNDLGRKLGLFNTMVSLGTVFGPLLAGWALAGLGYRGAYGAFALTAAGCLAAVHALGAPSPRSSPNPSPSLLRNLSRLAQCRPVVLAALCRYAAAVPLALLSSFLPVYLRQTGMGPTAIGAITSMRGIFLLVASLACVGLFDRIPPLATWLAGMGGVGAAVAAVPLFGEFLPIAICAALMGFCSAPLQILALAMVARSVPLEQRSLAIAFTGTLWGISLWLNPLLLGLVIQATTIEAGFYAAGIGLIMLGWLGPRLLHWAAVSPG